MKRWRAADQACPSQRRGRRVSSRGLSGGGGVWQDVAILGGAMYAVRCIKGRAVVAGRDHPARAPLFRQSVTALGLVATYGAEGPPGGGKRGAPLSGVLKKIAFPIVPVLWLGNHCAHTSTGTFDEDLGAAHVATRARLYSWETERGAVATGPRWPPCHSGAGIGGRSSPAHGDMRVSVKDGQGTTRRTDPPRTSRSTSRGLDEGTTSSHRAFGMHGD